MSWEDCMPMQIIFYNFLKANFPKPFVMNENTFTLFSEPESDLVNYIFNAVFTAGKFWDVLL